LRYGSLQFFLRACAVERIDRFSMLVQGKRMEHEAEDNEIRRGHKLGQPLLIEGTAFGAASRR
jgi:hypothetical protein